MRTFGAIFAIILCIIIFCLGIYIEYLKLLALYKYTR